MGDGSGRRRPVAVVLALLLVAAIAVSAVVLRDGDRPPVDSARSLLDDDGGFDTGIEAGETLAKVAQHLERAVGECRAARGGRRCQALSAALGYSQVLAPWVLQCTGPGRYEARTRMASYLEQVDAVTIDAARVPGPPRLPSCVE